MGDCDRAVQLEANEAALLESELESIEGLKLRSSLRLVENISWQQQICLTFIPA